MFLRVFLWTGAVLEVWNTLQKLDQFPESKIVATQIRPTYRMEQRHSGGPLLSDTSKPQAGCSPADRKNQNWPKSSGRISFLDLLHMKTTQRPGSSSKWWYMLRLFHLNCWNTSCLWQKRQTLKPSGPAASFSRPTWSFGPPQRGTEPQ